MKLSRQILLLVPFLLAGAVAAQTLTVPITGSATLPDGTKVPFTGTGTLTLPQPPPPPPPVVLYGPRDPVGPDVPLTAAEQTAFSRRVAVAGFTTAAIQSACDSAKAQGIPVVYLPVGTYTLTTFVNVPAGLTILGAGSGTLLKPATPSVECLYTRGDNVRYTRLKLLGPATGTWESTTTARGIEAWGNQNVRVDHCDLAGFAYATLYMQNATGQVDHNRIHDCRVIGLGYGVVAAAGAQVSITDNEFSDVRHALASNGGGTRPTTYDFSHNRITSAAPSPWQIAGVNTHPKFDGTFTITANRIEKMPQGIGVLAGSGTISGNLFADCATAVKVYTAAESGFVGTPHDITISGNSFGSNVLTKYYVVPAALRVTVDGRPFVSPAVRKPGARKKGKR